MSRRGSSVGLVSVLVLAAGLVGCGDDDAEPADDGGTDLVDTPETETGDEAGDEGGNDAMVDDGGPSGTLSVLVQLGEWVAADETWPAEGAAVALDAPGGGRLEQVSGADGRVVFEGLDWSLGTAAVTAYVEGYAAGSWVAVEERTDDLVVNLMPLAPPPEHVTVSGTSTNLPPGAAWLTVSATHGSTAFWGELPDWSLLVEPGTPFSLLAAARHWEDLPGVRGNAWPIDAWLRLDHAAVTAATTVELDFSGTPLAPLTVTGSLPFPMDPDSRLRRQGYAWATVGSIDGNTLLGLGVRSLVTADGNDVEYDLEYFEDPEVEHVVTRYTLVATDSVGSEVVVEGYPTPGAQDVVFMELPQLVSPSGTMTVHPLHDPIVFSTAETEFKTTIWIHRSGVSIWYVGSESPVTTVVVPELPLSVDSAVFPGPEGLQATLITGLNFPDSAYFERYAYLGTFLLQP